MSTGLAWSAEDRDRLANLVTLGLTAREIAKFFPERTRNAVIGECHRRGFQLQHRPVHVDATHRNPIPPKRPPKDKEVVVPAGPQKPRLKPSRAPRGKNFNSLRMPIERKPGNVRLQELAERHCRWPMPGPGNGPDAPFCGLNKVDGYPYCVRHCRMAYPGFKRWDEVPLAVKRGDAND